MAEVTSAPAASGTSRETVDDILNEAMASTGVDLSQPFDDSSTEESTTQPAPVSSPEPTSAAPEPTAGDAAPAAPTAEIEPTPFSFTGADGKASAIEGALVIAGDGLYVPEARIADLQQSLHRASALEAQNKAIYESHRTLEQLTEWKHVGTDGKQVTLTGREAVEASRVKLGETLAENKVLSDIPARLVETLIANDPKQYVGLDANGEVAWRQDALQSLQQAAKDYIARESGLLKRETTYEVRARMAQVGQPSQPSPSNAAPDIQSLSPAIVDQFATGLNAQGLTGEDKTFLQGMVGKYIRPATEQDRAGDFSIKVGEPVVDRTFGDLVTRTAQLRAGAATAAKTASEAAKVNANTSAARQPARRAPTTTAPTSPAPTGRKSKSAAWDDALQEGMEGIEV